MLLAGGEIVGDECKAARFGVDRLRLHLAPSPTVHSDKEDSLFCSFVALKIILSIGHFTLAYWQMYRCQCINGSEENI